MVKEPLTKSVSVAELLHMRNEDHLTNRQIAERLDVHPATILRYIGPDIRQPVQPRKGKRCVVTTKLVDSMREMYLDGKSINTIAEHVGLSWKTVKKYIADLGPNRKKKLQPEAQDPVGVPATPVAAVPVVTARTPVCTVVSSRRTVKLKGLECQYEVETDGKTGTLTVTNGSSEVAIFDAGSLDAFIAELTMIRKDYLSEVSA